MSTEIRFKRGTTAAVQAYSESAGLGEPIFDINKKRLYIGTDTTIEYIGGDSFCIEDDTLDDINDGTTYGRVANLDLTSNRVDFDKLSGLSASMTKSYLNQLVDENIDIDGDDGITISNTTVSSALTITTAASNGILISNATADGLRVTTAGGDAIQIDNATVHGLNIVTAGSNAINIVNATTNALNIATAGQYAIGITNSTGDAIHIVDAGGNAIEIEDASAHAILVDNTSAGDALHITNAFANGICIDTAGNDAIEITNATAHGMLITNAGADGIHIVTATDNAIEIENATSNGILISDAGGDAIQIDSATTYGISIVSAGSDGINITTATGNGIKVENAGGSGIVIANATSDGLKVTTAGNDAIQVTNSGTGHGLNITTAGVHGINITTSTTNAINVVNAGHYGVSIAKCTTGGYGPLYIENAGVAGAANLHSTYGSAAVDALAVDSNHDLFIKTAAGTWSKVGATAAAAGVVDSSVISGTATTDNAVIIDANGLTMRKAAGAVRFDVNEDGSFTLGNSGGDNIAFTTGDAMTITSATLTSCSIAGDEIDSGTVAAARIADLSATYAVVALGVTNGNTHDHSGGDGAQINHTTLSNIGTNTHAQIDTAVSNSVSHISASAAHSATGAVVGTTNNQTLTNKRLTSPKFNEDVTMTATSTELNLLDGVSGLVQADFTKLAAITASATEINRLDGSNGINITNSSTYGLKIDESGTAGILIGSVAGGPTTGIHIEKTDAVGIYMEDPGTIGLEINSPGTHGIKVNNSGNSSSDAIYITDSGRYGLHIVDSDNSALRIDTCSGGHAIEIVNSYGTAIEVTAYGLFGVFIGSPGATPTVKAHMSFAAGCTSDTSTPANGMLLYNSTAGKLRFYHNGWVDLN